MKAPSPSRLPAPALLRPGSSRAFRGWAAPALLVLLSCRGQPETAGTDSPELLRSAPDSTIAAPGTATERVIRPDGIGLAGAGLTVGEFRSRLPPDTRLGSFDDRFMVDISAAPVMVGADTLYHLLFSAGAAVTDTAHLEMVATLDESFRTPEGVGPGTSLADASVAYGSPTLSYSVYDELREYASFPGYSNDAVWFRVASGSDASSFAGIYTTELEHNETSSFHPDARITMVIVDLRR